MPTFGPVPLSQSHVTGDHEWRAESVTPKSSWQFEDSRTKATSRSPGRVVMFTENEENAAPLTSMLFWTCTTAGGGPPPVEERPGPVRLTGWFVPAALLSLSVTVRGALRLPAPAGFKLHSTEH